MRAFTSACLLILLGSATGLAAVEAIAPGSPVPPLTLTTLDGAATSVAALRGEGPLVLMAWCSSCHSCRGAEGAFDRFAREYRGTVPIYALASNPTETVAAVRTRQQQGQLEFPVLLDASGALADACGVTRTTTALVIAADGTLAYRGPFAQDDTAYAAEALHAVLAGGQPAQPELPQQGCPIR
jgi:peroxiredoxin